MSIATHEAYDNSTITCDKCGRDQTYPTSKWNLLMHDAKDDGWRVYQENGEWKHSCPDCVKEWARNKYNKSKEKSPWQVKTEGEQRP